MTFKKAKKIMMNSKDTDTFYDTDTELDELNALSNEKSCEVDVHLSSEASNKRSNARAKFVRENHRKYHLNVKHIEIGSILRDTHGGCYVPLFVSYVKG